MKAFLRILSTLSILGILGVATEPQLAAHRTPKPDPRKSYDASQQGSSHLLPTHESRCRDGGESSPSSAVPPPPPYFSALEGSGVRLRMDAGGGRGRGLVATRSCNAGARLLSEDVYAFAPLTADGVHSTRSHLTLAEVPGLLRCGGCGFAMYRTGEEQREAWVDHHRDECSLIKRCLEHGYSPSSTLLLVTRILHRKRREGESAQSTSSSAKLRNTARYAEVLALDHKYLEWGDNQMAMMSQIAYTVRDFLGGNETFDAGVDMREVFHLLGRVRCNAYAITDDDLRIAGVGVYPAASLANHDCRPNAVASFEDTRLHLRATRPIREGEEVTVSYVDCADESDARAKALSSRFCFNCTCPRCVDAAADDCIKRALRCPSRAAGGGGCPGWMEPWSDKDWAPHRRRFVARSLDEHLGETVSPWSDWVEGDGRDTKDAAASYAFHRAPDSEGPVPAGLDEDVDRHLERLEEEALAGGQERRKGLSLQEVRGVAAQRVGWAMDAFVQREAEIYGTADEEWAKLQVERVFGPEGGSEAAQVMARARDDVLDSERLRVLQDDVGGWRYGRPGQGRGDAEEVEEVLACCVCGATVPSYRIVEVLRSAGMLVGDARAVKWRYASAVFDQRRERILAGQPQETKLTIRDQLQGQERAAKEASPSLLAAVKAAAQVLHTRNVGLLRLLEAAVHHTARAGMWEEAAVVGNALSASYRAHYPPLSPILSVHLALMGKVLVHLAASAGARGDFAAQEDMLQGASRELRDSLDGLRVSNGPDSTAAKRVEAMLRDVDMSLQGRGSLT